MSADIQIAADFLIDGFGAPARVAPEIHISEGRFASVQTGEDRLGGGSGALMHFPGCTVLPGLIDSHVHLAMSPDVAAKDVADDMTSTPDSELLVRAERNARLALQAGVTTLRDCGSPRSISVTLRNAIRAGLIVGPRLFAAGRPITTRSGHCHFMGEWADNEDEVRKAARKLCQEGVDFIKIMATGGMLTPGSNPAAAQYSVAELSACAGEAHRLGRKVAAHVLCSQGLRYSVAAGIDTIEHCWSISGGPQDADQDTIESLAASGSFGSVTAHRSLRELLNQGDAGLTELRRRLEPHRAMRSAGVPLPVHSDAGTPGTRFEHFHQSIEAYRRGLQTSLEEAVQAATHVPAAALGMADSLGRIEPGYVADLIVVRGAPSDENFSLAEPLAVLMAGKIVVKEGLCRS